MFPEYEVIIPHYERPDRIRVLLTEIFNANKARLPNRVLVIDDFSGPEATASLIRIRSSFPQDIQSRIVIFLSKRHQGLYPSYRLGISQAKTRFVVCCVDDIKLYLKKGQRLVCPSLPNPFVTLTYYLKQLDDAFQEGIIAKAGAVFPYVLRWELPSKVFVADKSVYSLPPAVLPVISNNLLDI